MSLPLPNLDDKKFQGLVDEAVKLIPQYNRDWTNYNVSDPGITLIELFAWMIEGVLYQLNDIPLENKRKMLSLLGLDEEELKDLTDENLEEKILKVFDNRGKRRGITDGDFENIVLDALDDFNLGGKVYTLNNINFRDFEINPNVAYYNEDRMGSVAADCAQEAALCVSGDGHNTVIVIPDKRIVPLPEILDKLQVQSAADYNTYLKDSMGILDPYFEGTVQKKSDPFVSKIETDILKPDSSVNHYYSFGSSMSVYNDKLLIGTPSLNVRKTGRAFIYKIVNGIIQRKDDGTPDVVELRAEHIERYFGKAVLMHENYAVVGTCRWGNQGELHIFEYQEGEWKATGYSPAIRIKDPPYLFASTVVGTEDFIFIGSPKKYVESNNGYNARSGAVHVTHRGENGWSACGDLESESPADNEDFGSALAVIEGFLAVAVPGRAKVCIYKHHPEQPADNCWQLWQNIILPASAQSTFFGKALAMNEEWLFISGRGRVTEVDGLPPGATREMDLVYVYRRDANDQWVYTGGKLWHDKNYDYHHYYGEQIRFDGANLVVSVRIQKGPKFDYYADVFRFNKVQKWYREGTVKIRCMDTDSSFHGLEVQDNTIFAGVTQHSPAGSALIMRLPLQLINDDFSPTPELLEEVRSFLDQRRIITNRIFVRGPVFRKYDVVLDVKLEKGVDLEKTRMKIKNSLLYYFDPVNGGPEGGGYPMGRTIYGSEIMELVEKTEGVDYLQEILIKDPESGIEVELKNMPVPRYYEILQLNKILFV